MSATARPMDFTNVKDAGNFNPRRKPAGDYRMKVVKVEDETSKAGNQQWVFTIVPTTDQRSTYPYYCGFDVAQAWKVRNLFIAAGIAVPKKKVRVDPNKLVNKEIGASLDDDEYEGKPKSTIVAVFPVSELSEDAPNSRPTSSTSTKKRRSSEPDDVDEDDEVGDDEDEELDLEEI